MRRGALPAPAPAPQTGDPAGPAVGGADDDDEHDDDVRAHRQPAGDADGTGVRDAAEGARAGGGVAGAGAFAVAGGFAFGEREEEGGGRGDAEEVDLAGWAESGWKGAEFAAAEAEELRDG